ncbi:hypothetical protein SGFS_063600 [Streptomyces graminofaciens]|uniref:Uncharacterized protein n=1 Tax=Streptomyces graminofaciens TaxID=68212 RepID=A0ABN5VNQ2_9ACTN|nr:hypothetical protein SGFS_063600 [Streptomyces graminofaciens]
MRAFHGPDLRGLRPEGSPDTDVGGASARTRSLTRHSHPATSGEALQRGEDRDVDRVPGRPQPGQGVGAGCSFELSVSGANALGCGDEDVGDLVQGGGACFDRGAGGVVQGAW